MLETIFQNCDWLQITGLLVSAILIGINKTALPGIGTLPVIFLTLLFQAHLATGLQLIMLCTADLMAVAYYRKSANWKLVLRLLPCALCGIALGSVTLRFVTDEILRNAIGIIILLMAALHFIHKHWINPDKVPNHPAFIMMVGIVAGFTTQVANAAGPVMALYLLAMRLPKEEYMGTCAWYFMILNWIKMPIFIMEGRITQEALLIDLPMLPIVLLGAFLGVLFLRKIKQKTFETAIQILIVLSALYLLFPKDFFKAAQSAENPINGEIRLENTETDIQPIKP